MRVRFENGSIDFSSSVGIGLQNRFGQNLFEFLFIGGDTNYVINDSVISHNTGLPFTSQGMDLEFQLTTPTTYRFVASGVTFTGTLAVTSESVIDRFRAWNYSAGSGSNHNLYLTDLSVVGPTQLQSAVYQDEVAVTRRPGPFSDMDRDGYVTWEEEFAGTDPDDPESHLPDMPAVLPQQQGTVHLPSTAPAKWYDIFVRTSLVHGAWQPTGAQQQGSGAPLTLHLTNVMPTAFYRTGVYEP